MIGQPGAQGRTHGVLCCCHLEILTDLEQGAPLPPSVLGPNKQGGKTWASDCSQGTRGLLQATPTWAGGHLDTGPLLFLLSPKWQGSLVENACAEVH